MRLPAPDGLVPVGIPVNPHEAGKHASRCIIGQIRLTLLNIPENNMNVKLNTFLYVGLFSGLGIFSFFLLVNYSGFSPQVADALYSVGACLFFIAAFNVLGHFTIRISSWLNDRYALNAGSRWKIVSVYAGVMLMFLLLNYGLLVTAKLLAGASRPFIFPNGGVRILIVVWLVELVILGLLLAFRSMQNLLRLQQQAAALQKENNTARYAALQSQLNPHFLFNSLNTLIAEIEYNPGNAVSFTKNLSDVYRYVLQCQDKPLVTLGEEMEFMKAYLFLHEVRLGDCIACDIGISDDYRERMLPPLTLQLLVENVIKHNSVSAARPMKIAITTEEDYLVVSNRVQPKKSAASPGIGLQNLSNRCRLITGKEIRVSDEGGVFTVKIPFADE